jgi:hypothetical protein
MTEGYFVEYNGECWQSVFPSCYADMSSLHLTIDDALDYMTNECGVDLNLIVVCPQPELIQELDTSNPASS